MNRIHTTLAILLIAAGITGWQIWKQTDSGPAASSETAPLAETTVPDAQAAESVASQPAVAEERTAVPEKFHPERCTWETVFFNDPVTGNVSESRRCTPNEPPQPDPYASWDNETLAAAAYSDPGAAQELGLRLLRGDTVEQETLGVSLLIRSVAITGDPEAFRKAIGVRYAEISIDGVPQIRNLKQQLLFSIIGQTLGDDRFDPQQVERALLRANIDPTEIEKLQKGSRAILERMAALQTEMTGETSIREALGNA